MGGRKPRAPVISMPQFRVIFRLRGAFTLLVSARPMCRPAPVRCSAVQSRPAQCSAGSMHARTWVQWGR